MKKISFSFLIFISISQIGFCQSIEKIKGNRNVTEKQTYVDDFSSLVIKNDFEVKLAYNNKTSVEIETDSNLHNVINIDVNSGVLSISTSKRITSNKKLLITINYSENLNNIELYDNAELRSVTSLELKNLTVSAKNSSEVNLTVRSSLFKYYGLNKSKAKINIMTDSSAFILNNSSKIDALITSKASTFELFENTNANIEGSVNECKLRLNNSAYFKGKNYTIENADITMLETSDVELNVTSLLTLKASGGSETYIYGKPKIDLQHFSDKAKLQKKNL